MIDGLTLDIAGRAVGAALLHSVWQGAWLLPSPALPCERSGARPHRRDTRWPAPPWQAWWARGR